MRRIACAVLLALAAPAWAQTPPGRWSMAFGERLCQGEPMHERGGLNWRLTCEARCPASSAPVTGACRTVNSDNLGIVLEGAGPTANGWSCDFIAPHLDVGRSGSITRHVRVKAEAHCRDTGQTPLGRWSTPTEDTPVVVARSGEVIGEKIRAGIRLCNTDGAVPVNVQLLLRDAENPAVPQRPAAQAVPPGHCLQVDQPVAVFVQNGSRDLRLAGTYQVYKDGTFKPQPEVVSAIDLARNARDERAIARRALKSTPPEFVRAACEKLDPAPAGIWGRCAISEIAELGNYRVCFAPNYAPPASNEPNHPGHLLPMVTNPKLAQLPLPSDYHAGLPGGRDAHNPIQANSCRDYFNVREVNVLLLDNETSRPANVRDVWFTRQKLG